MSFFHPTPTISTDRYTVREQKQATCNAAHDAAI
jgi:hypothetical protein